MRRLAIAVLGLLILAGCGRKPAEPGPPVLPSGAVASEGLSDPAKVREADYSILFVGNSHTYFHDLPNLVGSMIQHRFPDKKVFVHVVGVGFLEDAAKNSLCTGEIESRPWKCVVLQAQKISMSGRHEYSRREGIDLAKQAKSRGARVYYFSEWGLQGVEGDGAKQEKVYREMATEAGVSVAPIGQAWDLALAERPDLPLHSPDGNHQSEIGAFLTSCILFAHVTGESPATLAAFPAPQLEDRDRKFLLDVGSRSFAKTRHPKP